ncbi:unnamed protein product [Anisakis simplex]|uniref:Lipoyl-binding domain-containing protein n=1 Tax=Anisakis simplex TaxID=6269 RepID=A0A0M3JF61_ANISI|nr:unnamed protein product [Anisakis simplex]
MVQVGSVVGAGKVSLVEAGESFQLVLVRINVTY